MATWTYRATGSVATNGSGAVLAPGAPTGKAVGDLLLGVTWQRSASTITSLSPDWTELFIQTGTQTLNVWARIADGTSADDFAPDWGGTSSCGAFVEAWYGGGYTDLSTIVAHSAGVNSSGSTPLVLPAFTGGSVAGCLLWGASRKNNTATDATTISHAALTVRTQVISGASGNSHVATGSTQQTTYVDFDGTDFTIDGTAESLASNGIILYLRTESAVKYLKLLAHSSAASATSVAGVVFSAPTGGAITGTTRYGEFTNKTFEASLESGKAVLKVPVADFGGSALTTSDSPVALVRNTTKTTGIVTCTVIEE